MSKKECAVISYLPFQPGFEQNPDYKIHIVQSGHPLYGVVSDFYQFSVCHKKEEATICVIPDGCVDIVFRYGKNGTTKAIERCLRQKQMIPISEEGSVFGVRFLPGAINKVVNVYAAELLSSQIPLLDVLKKDSLLEQMEETFSFEGRIQLMAGYLTAQLMKPSGPLEIVRYCTNKIFLENGIVSIADLAKETGYTARYLREVFYRNVGISPKELSEIIQFQKSFFVYYRQWEKSDALPLSAMALQYGYYDQSHMNKTYWKMAGCLPKRLYAEIHEGRQKVQ